MAGQKAPETRAPSPTTTSGRSDSPTTAPRTPTPRGTETYAIFQEGTRDHRSTSRPVRRGRSSRRHGFNDAWRGNRNTRNGEGRRAGRRTSAGAEWSWTATRLKSKVQEQEKTQRNFDKILAEEKLNGEKISTERDKAEGDAREKETKLLNHNQGMEERQQQLDESERSGRQLQIELDNQVNTQGNTDKNVHEQEKAKRQGEQELAEQRTQREELEDVLQQTEDQKMQLEVNMQAFLILL